MYTLLNVLKTMEQRISVRSHPHCLLCVCVCVISIRWLWLALLLLLLFSPILSFFHTQKNSILPCFVRFVVQLRFFLYGTGNAAAAVAVALAVLPSSRLRFFLSYFISFWFFFLLYFIHKSVYISACLAIKLFSWLVDANITFIRLLRSIYALTFVKKKQKNII